MPRPYSFDEVEAAKTAARAKSGLADTYVRALIWRCSGEDAGVDSVLNPVHLAIAIWEWGTYLRRRQDEGREARHLEMETPVAQGSCYHPGT